jgi:hypothetical protein
MNGPTLLGRLAEEFGFTLDHTWARELTGVDTSISNGYSLIGTYVDRNRPYLRTPGKRALFLVCDGRNPKTYGLAELAYSGFVFALQDQYGDPVIVEANYPLWAKEFHPHIESWMAGPEVDTMSLATAPVDPTYDAAVQRLEVLTAAMAAMVRHTA